MNDISSNSTAIEISADAASAPDAHARTVLKLLESITQGELKVVLPDSGALHFGQSVRGEEGATSLHRAQLIVHDYSALSLALSRGDVGFGEGYMQGLWSTPDLTALLRLLIANREVLTRAVYGQWWSIAMDQIKHMLRFNRKSQARKNIAAHYDLGNDFYRCWLDPSMSYSSALFDGTGCWERAVDLPRGQLRKIDRAIDEMQPHRFGPDSQILEIGCGWGGLAHRLLSRTPVRYTGLTLSTEQKHWTEQLLEPAGRQRFDVRLQDYRDETGCYDGIVSIEMFEAVGERYWDAYFSMLARCLKPDGVAVIQTITIDERLFKRYRRGTDFIQQYIFPGGMLPSAQEFTSRAQAQGLTVTNTLAFGQDYARTLAEWAKTFDGQRETIQSLGFDERFQRMWRFYLSYCEAGFAQNNIDVLQFTLRHAS